MTAQPGMPIGKWAGQRTRKNGVGNTHKTFALGQSDCLRNLTIAMLASRIGKKAGPSGRNSGVAKTAIEVVVLRTMHRPCTTVMLILTIGNGHGKMQKRHGVVNIMGVLVPNMTATQALITKQTGPFLKRNGATNTNTGKTRSRGRARGHMTNRMYGP